MGTAHRWERNRFGILFQANLATVPAWAPIGNASDWYRAHLDGGMPDVFLQPSPMAETLAHHRDRWAHVEEFDDFIEFLSFDEFDPEAWIDLVGAAGASYAVLVAKDRDGLCWWDAPATDRTVLHAGPRRNVLAEFAASCRNAAMPFGAQYSLLDWGDPRYRGHDYAIDVVRPHVLDLVERYGIELLWGDGHWAGGESRWQSDQLLAAARATAPDLIVNDRWSANTPGVRTFEQRLPDTILDEPWETRRGLGSSFGHNRAERAEHLLNARGIISLLTEVLAKNGHLLLAVGPDATGAIPELHERPLRDTGRWIDRHRALVERGRPWLTWGDPSCRLLTADDELFAIDVTGEGRFEALGRRHGEVTAVHADDAPSGTTRRSVGFEQTEHGLTIARRERGRDDVAAVYRVEIEPRPDAPIELFPPVESPPIELASLLADAEPGAIVQLGDGTYIGPARVPTGVTVRGLGPHRTVIDGLESCSVTLDERARIEHCTLRGGGQRIVWLPLVSVRVDGPAASLLGCHVDGHILVAASDTRITSCAALGVVVERADRVSVCRSSFTGTRWDCGVDITGGSGHDVDSCEFRDHLVAVRLTGTIGAEVRRNQVSARWWGIQVVDTDDTSIHGNSIARTMRAVDVDGGTLTEVAGNAVSDGDSGCLVQRGASAVTVAGNRWERCRIGLLLWDAVSVTHHDNDIADLAEPGGALVSGP